MDAWVWPGWVAVLGGGMVFVLAFVPLLAWQYRKFGRPSFPRVLGAAAVSVYWVAIFAYTLLPLPSSNSAWCAAQGIKEPQFVLFNFVQDIARDTRGESLLGVLTSRTTLQVVFNVVLFIPWGVLARRYFSFGVVTATLSGFAVSLLIEATQTTGVWGLYSCAYRLGDVDDLLMNTLGALLGALIAPLLLWWMPARRKLEAQQRQPRPVSSARRWFGMLLDLMLFGVVGYLLLMIGSIAVWALGGTESAQLDAVLQVLSNALAGLLVFFIPALLGSGASLGQRIVWLAPKWPARGGSLRRLWRAMVVGGSLTVVAILSVLFGAELWASFLNLLLMLILLLSFFSVPFSRGKRGLSFILSGAELIDSRSPVAQRS